MERPKYKRKIYPEHGDEERVGELEQALSTLMGHSIDLPFWASPDQHQRLERALETTIRCARLLRLTVDGLQRRREWEEVREKMFGGMDEGEDDVDDDEDGTE